MALALTGAACTSGGSAGPAITGSPSTNTTGSTDPTPDTSPGTSRGTSPGGSPTTTPGNTTDATQPGTTQPGTTQPGTDPGGPGQKVRLAPFADCSAYLDYVKTAAAERVGPYGLDGGPRYEIFEDDMATADDAGDDDSSAAPQGTVPASAEGGSDGSFTGTNTQEAGVDEPDIVKTDGNRIMTVSENVFSYVDVSSGEPVLTDQITIEDGWDHQLFFSGDRALLFTNGGDWATTDSVGASDSIYPPGGYHPAAIITEIDLSDPANLSISASMRIEGQYLSARAIGNRVRLATSTGPEDLPWVYPQSQASEDLATETNRTVVERSTYQDWAPSYTITSQGATTEGDLLDCSRLQHPTEFSGFDVISIVDIGMDDGLANSMASAQSVGVLASGQTVYSSTDRMYVATTRWVAEAANGQVRDQSVDGEYTTSIHAFSISPGEPTEYVASGSVGGSLLNQFSLDEHNGYLRVIVTEGAPWSVDDQSESRLIVLEEQSEGLTEVGSVGGLGQGERLYSARLMGDVGFAVTFRQVDPFYVLDLSDPTNPQVTGELKIPGFSTYLHPVGDNLVLGLGQDATDEGRTTGLKLSLFDVSNPTSPQEISVWTMPDAYSPAESDHRAFQMSGNTAIVPVTGWDSDFNGAVVFDISANGITELGRVDHSDQGAVPQSDCDVLDVSQVTEDSELFYMSDAHIQICSPNDVGGYGSWVCDRIPSEELQYWFYDEQAATDQMTALGIGEDDELEICWNDGQYARSIQRSLVIESTLWTMSPSQLQANDVSTFERLATVAL